MAAYSEASAIGRAPLVDGPAGWADAPERRTRHTKTRHPTHYTHAQEALGGEGVSFLPCIAFGARRTLLFLVFLSLSSSKSTKRVPPIA
jgi:hypothetical protein